MSYGYDWRGTRVRGDGLAIVQTLDAELTVQVGGGMNGAKPDEIVLRLANQEIHLQPHEAKHVAKLLTEAAEKAMGSLAK